MIKTDNTHEEDLELYDLYPSGHSAYNYKRSKGYNRAEDRRKNRLYEHEYEEDEVDEFDEEETRLF